MPRYLQPPHIQMGAYWHELSEADAFRKITYWLLERRYSIHRSEIDILEGSEGKLPRFRGLVIDAGLRRVMRVDMNGENPFRSSRLFPVQVRLVPETSRNVPVDVCYALMLEDSFLAGDPHVVEIVASGADLNCVGNAGTQSVSRKVHSRAQRVKRWSQETFRSLCDELRPDYAAFRWEYELQPPNSLIKSTDVMDFCDIYLSKKLGMPESDIIGISRLKSCLIERFDAGVFVKSKGGLLGDDKQSEVLMDAVRRGIGLLLLRK